LHRANRKLAVLESPDRRVCKPVPEAIAAWRDHTLELADSSKLRYRRVMRHLEAFCKAEGITTMEELGLEQLDAFRAGRTLARTTSARELQVLRNFFGFCLERRWVAENWARKIKTPKAKPKEVVPYTPEEMADILAACDNIGRTSYERRRARAMILLMRHTGLRISDVATLAKSRVNDGRIMLFTQKTGSHVLLPIPTAVQTALDALPVPRGAGKDRGFFFWNCVGSQRTVIGRAERSLGAVFRKSGVHRAHSHRFRHTLATEILVKGGTEQDVADILGISPNIVRKHYAKWTPQRQQRIFNLMQAVQAAESAAKLLQIEKGAIIQ
jgi:integrase